MVSRAAKIPPLALSHGQALWVLENMGFRTGDTPTAFNAYLMGLRRAGLPFADDELGRGPGHNVTYRYEHLMELTVALALRAQAILPRDIVGLLAQHRDRLRQIYRRAWTERDTGLGAQETIIPGKETRFRLAGIYLDLRLSYTETGFLFHIAPTALSPGEAVVRMFTKNIAQHVRGPLAISELAEQVVHLAPAAPEVRRGRRA
jgi:hypothetical protein